MPRTTPEAPSAPRHEPALYGRLANGTIPTYRSGGRALYERQFTDDWTGPGGWWEGPEAERPAEPPAALVPACSCGWRGADVPYDPHGGPPPPPGGPVLHDAQEQEAQAAWHRHYVAATLELRPPGYDARTAALAAPLGELAEDHPRAALVTVRQLRELADHLELLAVAAALAHRVPWHHIGADLGQTRQAVHGRYTRRPSADLAARVQELTGGQTVPEFLAAARERRPHTAPPTSVGWPAAVRRILDPHHGPAPAPAEEG
ncbi:hypothetical protein [Streptomyces alboflavus]|uniref:hypothetical protein n=1 Tax=Streptomyces alboflavus TaxID=67267 RepID=UPI0018777825|nr:hypothetical protein [Streptomyces alboflavus]